MFAKLRQIQSDSNHRYQGAFLAGCALIYILLSGCQTTSTLEEKNDIYEQQWGVHVLGIHRTAAGYMLDFRYRVLDAEKATPILNRRIKPELLVEKDNRILRVPVTSKLGPLRQSAKFAKQDRNYFMFFANPAKLVQRGDKVTIVIGDFRAEHLIVN